MAVFIWKESGLTIARFRWSITGNCIVLDCPKAVTEQNTMAVPSERVKCGDPLQSRYSHVAVGSARSSRSTAHAQGRYDRPCFFST